MKTVFWMLLLMAVVSMGSAQAAALFTQCPPVGVNTGCQFLITINATGIPTVAMDPNVPNNGPYDGSDDTLIGVLNNSSRTITSLPLSSSTNIFAFDGDGACTQTPGPANCGPDPSGYGSPNATFTAINVGATAGTVLFPAGLAPGGSTWFDLEDALASSTQITPGTPGGTGGGTVPEPASMTLLGGGAAFLLVVARWRK
jgi:hypothetical protein